MINYYNHDGEPITLEEWARLIEIPEYRIVASDVVGPLWVSTIWLGLDHNWFGGDPFIFETILFDVPQGDDRWSCLEMQRCSTHTQALENHARLLGLAHEIEGLNNTKTGETDGTTRTDQEIHDHVDRGREADGGQSPRQQ